MAKSLGQIHTVNYSTPITFGSTTPQNLINIDLPGELTSQLQRQIRWGQFFKVVGIDMTLDTVGTLGGGQVVGYLRYYAPTRGRCDAVKGAFQSMREQMDIQGISMRDNKMYDFRAPLNEFSHTSGVFPNRATLGGPDALALNHGANEYASIFAVHNRSQQPQYTGTAGEQFQPGFETLLQPDGATATDFVINDTIMYTGNHNFADTEYETIPFTMTWTPDTTDLAVSVQWRPDPALYLAVLCGQFSMVIEEANYDGSNEQGLNIDVAVHVSGWKSIMGNPDKKRRRRNSSKKTRRGRKK